MNFYIGALFNLFLLLHHCCLPLLSLPLLSLLNVAFLFLMAMVPLIIEAKEDVVVGGILTASSTSPVVRINVVKVMILGSKIVVMGAIESNSLTEHHPISGLIHDRSGVSYAIFLVTQSSNIHN